LSHNQLTKLCKSAKVQNNGDANVNVNSENGLNGEKGKFALLHFCIKKCAEMVGLNLGAKCSTKPKI